MTAIIARAPGRVNLIGDHTDYTGGLCFPMAIDKSVEVRGERRAGSGVVRLRADGYAEAAVDLEVADPASVEPAWARYVAGVVAQVRPAVGFEGVVTSTVPAEAGLSSSAALEVAVALALGADPSDPVALARICQAAEHAARGVPTGLLDQLASIGGVAGHGLLLDCRALTITPVALPPPDEAQWLVVFTGARSLADSQYSARARELAKAEAEIGPLRDATAAEAESIGDREVRARARHVVSENHRVTAFASAVAAGDVATAGALMSEGHRSLTGDFESSTPSIDELCSRLDATDGVLGSRITGGGWGGCVVALTRPGAVDPASYPAAWFVLPAAGATVSAA